MTAEVIGCQGHFRFNLRRMVEMPRRAGVPLLLVNPVANLRDCPPFKTQHGDGLTPDDLKRWKAHVSEAAEHEATNMYQAAMVLEETRKIDDQHAGLHYLLAKCYDASGMTDQAHRAYLEAKELDICPLRILKPMNQAVLDVARESGTPLVDVRKLFEARSDSGIPGGYLLLDHVHPSIPGHQLIANALAAEMVRLGFVDPAPDWPQRRELKFAEHLGSLGDLYFSRGLERLERLRCWTQGKGNRIRGSSNTGDQPLDHESKGSF
ncbi:MAG: SGNH/GDSL hydrolase family protein [Planctomycetota bacterium]